MKRVLKGSLNLEKGFLIQKINILEELIYPMENKNNKNYRVIGYSDHNNYNQITLSSPDFEGTYLSPNKSDSSLPHWEVVRFEPDCFVVEKIEDSSLIKRLSEKSKRISEKESDFERFLAYF